MRGQPGIDHRQLALVVATKPRGAPYQEGAGIVRDAAAALGILPRLDQRPAQPEARLVVTAAILTIGSSNFQNTWTASAGSGSDSGSWTVAVTETGGTLSSSGVTTHFNLHGTLDATLTPASGNTGAAAANLLVHATF